MTAPTVEIIPCLSDNYAYILETRGGCVIVDPGELDPVVAALNGRKVLAILCTHHHPDHVGGVPGLLGLYPMAEVLVSAHDRLRIKGASRSLTDEERFELGDLVFGVRHVPGHTLGAVTFLLEAKEPLLFTGDTLFAAGCGRVFEGTMEMMLASMDLFGSLPTDARVYCGHEYTESNLRFAAFVAEEGAVVHSGTRVDGGLLEGIASPGAAKELSVALASRFERIHTRQTWAKERRSGGEHTMGQPLEVERATNPFLAVPRSLPHEARVECFGALRRAKDAFRG